MTSSFDPTDIRLLRLLAGATDVTFDAALASRASMLRVEGSTLQALAGADLPAGTRAILEAGRLESAARASWLTHEATRLSRGLAAAAIEHRIVKGLAVAAHAPRPGDRWMDDVDVLVRAADRQRVVTHLRARNFRHDPFVTYAGTASQPERDRRSAAFRSPHDAPFDLHFLDRPLPRSDDGRYPTVAETAAGIADHAILHHAGDVRFVARMITDLRAFLESGHAAILAEEAGRTRTLAVALSWIGSLSRGLEWRPERAFPLRGRLRHVARSLSLAREGGLRAAWPSRRYLTSHDPEGAAAPALTLHARRWRRMSGALLS